MVRAGLFKDVDVMLSTHVGTDFGVSYGPVNTGLVSTQYSFHGTSAHAAGPPWTILTALESSCERLNA